MWHGYILFYRGNGSSLSHPDKQSALEAGGKISREQAYALVSTNIEKILGLDDVTDGGLGETS